MMNTETTEDRELQQLVRVLKEFAGEVMRHSTRDMGCLIRNNDLSLPQVATLMQLHRCGMASISEISEYLNLSLAATSQLVERLVTAGYVTRTEDPGDRRHKRVTLTGEGLAMVEEVKQTRIEEVSRRLRTMPDALRLAMLDTMQQAIDFLRGTEPRQDEIDTNQYQQDVSCPEQEQRRGVHGNHNLSKR